MNLANKIHRILLAAFCLIGANAATFAQSSPQREDRVTVFYREGKTDIDLTYKQNKANLERFIARYDSMNVDSLHRLVVKIDAYASPTGTTHINDVISYRRMAKLADYLKQHVDLPDSLLQIKAHGVDWEGLTQLLKEDQRVPARNTILGIIENEPIQKTIGKLKVDVRKNKIRSLNGGRTWNWLQLHLYPKLRFSSAVVSYEVEPKAQVDTVIPKETHAIDTIVQAGQPKQENIDSISSEKKHKSFIFAIKSNLLYDALVIPNIGAEFQLGKNWSLAGTYWYTWFRNNHTHHYWRTYGGELEGRKYLTLHKKTDKESEDKNAAYKGKRPFTGWHVGGLAQLFTYDFEFGGRGNLSYISYAVGVEGGYSHPVSRRLNLDFALALGYLGGKYKDYVPDRGCYVWIANKQRRWIGPVKAEVSLVWLIGKLNDK